MNRRQKKLKPKTQSFQFKHDDDTNLLKLHNLLTVKQIIAMKDRFEKQPGRHMSKNVFRKALLEIGHISLFDEEFDKLCKKIKYTRTLTEIYWEEFLTHLRVGLDSEDVENFSDKLELPITGAPREIKSHHRLPIEKILFMPEMKDRKVNHLYGSYVTCSRDGLINYWSMDMEKERTVFSKSLKIMAKRFKKKLTNSSHLENQLTSNHILEINITNFSIALLISQQTWITDIVVLPDVSVVCTSSTERDLRFYDTTANKFELRVMIQSLEDMVTAMNYTFYTDVRNDSKLLIGNSCGKAQLINIQSKDRGPFKSLPKMPLRTATYSQFLKGAINGMTVEEIPTSHTDWVRQIAYYENIHCTVSISSCSKESMLIFNAKSKKDCSYSFKSSKGFSCFAIADALHMVITGGPDFLVRMWNPFVPSRVITVLRGHHAGIVSITLQDDNRILVTLDKDKCVKVWDVAEQICLQSYYELPSTLGERTSLCTYYNPSSRQLFVASCKITYFRIYPLLNGDYTDGISHRKEVSVILYNSLFKSVVTCGFDSFIIIWNPWQGRRLQFIRNAHTTEMYGETVPVEITAATFDPSEQFLITGASDGTLKVWNFIIKSCIRNMAIGANCEIYSIVWLKNRILVMGENRVVTEFADCEDIGSSQYKSWVCRHLDDILCAAAYKPQMLITASYSGELIFWRMETGQPYGMYNVVNPTERITQYQNITKEKNEKRSMLKMSSRMKRLTKKPRKQTRTESAIVVSAGRISVNAVICLSSRAVHPLVGTLLVALDNGIIQMWSIHPGGGYLTEFKAVHNVRDYVVSICTDQENNYLFTGHMAGYIKTWHLVNYGIPEEDQVHVCMPELRLQFPFMWKDTFLGRAKRAHRKNVPILLNSFKAHLKPVTGIVYIEQVEILVSCSSDNSARIWTLGGRYMGTLGTFKPWTFISPTAIPDNTRAYPLPADIQRSASFTTYRVLCGGSFTKTPSKKQQMQEHMAEESEGVYGKRVNLDGILGKHFDLPERGFQHYSIMLDTSLPDVPIYAELVLPMPEKITRPPTPELVKNLKAQQKITAAKVPTTRTTTPLRS